MPPTPGVSRSGRPQDPKPEKEEGGERKEDIHIFKYTYFEIDFEKIKYFA